MPRLRALDRRLPMAAITVFVWIGVVTFFCTFAAILFLVAAWLTPLKAEEVKPADCLTSQAVFARTMQETKHPLLITLPPDLSRRFIIAWNMGIRGFAVPANTDTVALYDNPRAAFYKLAFFKRDCLVEAVDIPESTFWQVVGAADDTKWRI